MMGLVLKRLRVHWRTALVIELALIVALLSCFLLNAGLRRYRAQLLTRSQQNGLLVVGAPQGRLDLVMHALYFRGSGEGDVPFKVVGDLSELADAAPIFLHYTIAGMPLAGCDPTYFRLRGLDMAAGHLPRRTGECVLGSQAADRLGITVGQTVLTDPDHMLDFAAGIPLKLTVVGVLAAAGTADDDAAFTTLATAWTAHGIGHAHAGDSQQADLGIPWLDLTDPEVIQQLHFHGDQATFPLSAVLLAPHNARSRADLLEKSNGDAPMVLDPAQVMNAYLDQIAGLQELFAAISVAVAGTVVLLLAVIFLHGLRIRSAERDLLADLGAPRDFFLRLVLAEWILLLLLALAISWGSAIGLQPVLGALLQRVG